MNRYTGDLSSAVFQLAILQSRFGTLMKALCDDGVRVVVSERGPWSEKLVFAKSNLNANEFRAYSYTQEAMLRDLFPLAGPVGVGFLYLTLGVEDVLSRIATRGRAEEKAISKDYMAKLQAAHASMQTTLERDGLGAPNLVGSVRHVAVDANRTPAQVAAAVVESIERLLSADAFASSLEAAKRERHDALDALDAESTPPLDVAIMPNLPARAPSHVTRESLSKYESGLTRTDSVADHIESAESFKPAIVTRAEGAREAMREAGASPKASPKIGGQEAADETAEAVAAAVVAAATAERAMFLPISIAEAP